MEDIGTIERLNLAESVAELIRESITSGKIASGSRLVEADVAKQLNVSRGPVREAFRILETEGFLESRPGHGSYVAQISERDIREIYSLRCILEEEAFRLAIERRKEEDIQSLENILNDMFSSANEGDHAKVLNFDLDFHRKIWQIADQNRLQEMLNDLTTQIRIYVAVQTKIYDDLESGIADHQVLLDALCEKDLETGTKALRKHLELAVEMVSNYYAPVMESENSSP